MITLSSFPKDYRSLVNAAFLVLIIGLSACGGSGTPTQNEQTPEQSPPSETPPDSPPSSETTSITPEIINSGNWSDLNTWKDNKPPAENAEFVIPANLTLVVDSEILTKIKKITLEGTLQFAHDTNTRLNVDTINSKPNSLLLIGTKEQPIQPEFKSRIMFVDNGPITPDTDPGQLSRGAMLMGRVEINGLKKTAWLGLEQQPVAGESSIYLQQIPQGWQTGDRLVVAATDPKDPLSDEVAEILAIDGKTIHLASPLLKNHRAPKEELTVHVANLSRNVEFFSENPSIKHRGHIMFMHNLDVDINFARFFQLGRTDKSIPLDDWTFPSLDEAPPEQLERNNIRGRYSVHFHRGGADINATPAVIRGNVVEDDPGWAYVNHSSHVDFIDNVSYNVVGGAFQTEAGDELGSFINNIALRTVNPEFPLLDGFQAVPDFREDRQDFAFQGDAFWLHGGGVRVEGNVVAGASGHAYIYWPEGLIEPNTGMMKFKTSNIPGNTLPDSIKEIDIWYVPVSSFKNNTAYSATKGLTFFYLHASFFGLEEQVTPDYLIRLNSTFEDVLLWNMRVNALDFNFTEKVTLRNFSLYGNGDQQVIGVDANHFHNMGSYTFENFHIEGFGIGMDVPTQGDINIVGGKYMNLVDFRIGNPQSNARTLNFSNIEFDTSSYFPDKVGYRFEMNPNFTLFAEVQNGLESEESIASKHPLFFMMPDRINLNFGDYQNQSLYFSQQIPEFVPMTSANSNGPNDINTPSQYVNKSNQALFEEYNLRLGSSYIPIDAVISDLVNNGFIGSPSNAPIVMPPEIDF